MTAHLKDWSSILSLVKSTGQQLNWIRKKNLKKLVSLGETGFIPNIVLIKPDGSMVSNDRAEVLKKLEKFTSFLTCKIT